MKNISKIIVGPILRRIQGDRFSLWLIALDDVALKFSCWQAGGEAEPFFSAPVADSDRRVLKLGTHCYYIFLDITLNRPLPDEGWISYELSYQTEEGGWQSIVEEAPNLLYPTKTALGFQCDTVLKSLLHGSCRKPHMSGGDGLAVADQHLAYCLEFEDPVPSLFAMTGDQIYADDVAGPMLRAIHQVIARLDLKPEVVVGLEELDIATDRDLYDHEKSYYRRSHLLPQIEQNRALLDMFFGGVKKPIFTTTTANNHLITLNEHLAMYMLVWSPSLWESIDLSPPETLSDEEKALYLEELTDIQTFSEQLEKVQRVLAHCPVAMIFDDHDVTDDWNLNREWEEAAYTHPLSKRIIGNALLAYLLNQGWGNDPHRYGQLLDPLADRLAAIGDQSYDEFLYKLLGFEGWEYQWETQPPLVVLDTRTRRWRSERSAIQPSGLLDWEALGDMQNRLHGLDTVLLVSPAPIFGVKLIEVIQRIFTWLGKPLLVDAENWMSHPGTANAILNIFLHSKTPQNIVILSGDVHYSFVYDIELRREEKGPDIWQITASGLRNEFPHRLLAVLDGLNRWLYAPSSPLNWFTRRRRMRIIPRKPDGVGDGLRLLNHSGVGLVHFNDQGQPSAAYVLTTEGAKVGFSRMEHHSRWE